MQLLNYQILGDEMGYFLVLLYCLFNLGEGILVKNYAKKHGSGGMLMNAIIAIFSFFFFLVSDRGGFYSPKEMIPLAIINALLYATGFYLTYIAYQCGSFGLTRLISSFSLLISVFYGIFFLNEEATVLTYIGIALTFVAILLINYQKGESGEVPTASFKWLFCILISTLANGFISVLTRYQQIKFDNTCSNEFLSISLGGSFVILALIGIITERKNLAYIARHGSLCGLACGLLNGAKNLTTVFIYLFLPLSVFSPMQLGIGMILTFLSAFIIYKERYTPSQLVGVALGASAVILLAL